MLLTYVELYLDQDAQPRTIVALWKANMEEPNFSQPDSAVIISDISNSNFLHSSTRVPIAAMKYFHLKMIIC